VGFVGLFLFLCNDLVFFLSPSSLPLNLSLYSLFVFLCLSLCLGPRVFVLVFCIPQLLRFCCLLFNSVSLSLSLSSGASLVFTLCICLSFVPLNQRIRTTVLRAGKKATKLISERDKWQGACF
jgi:hypothetical protein